MFPHFNPCIFSERKVSAAQEMKNIKEENSNVKQPRETGTKPKLFIKTKALKEKPNTTSKSKVSDIIKIYE